jgi:hypothetical protein
VDVKQGFVYRLYNDHQNAPPRRLVKRIERMGAHVVAA